MAQQIIDIGSAPDDGTGDTIRAGGDKINDNFTELYGKFPVAVGEGGTGASSASAARDNLGLGSIATQGADSVSITGGTVYGLTDLAIGAAGASDKLEINVGGSDGGYRVDSTSLGTLAGYLHSTVGPHFVSHTDAGELSTGNFVAVRQTFSAVGYVISTSPATPAGNARTFTERLRVVPTNGHVGIEDTDPQALLSLGSAEDVQKVLVLRSGDFRQGFGVQPGEFRIFGNTNAGGTGRIVIGTVSHADGSTFNELVRVQQDGAVLVGTTVSTSAGAGDIVLPNATGELRAVNAAGTDTLPIVSLDAADLIKLGATRAAAATPANFSADFYIRLRDGSGNELYIPAMNASW